MALDSQSRRDIIGSTVGSSWRSRRRRGRRRVVAVLVLASIGGYLGWHYWGSQTPATDQTISTPMGDAATPPASPAPMPVPITAPPPAPITAATPVVIPSPAPTTPPPPAPAPEPAAPPARHGSEALQRLEQARQLAGQKQLVQARRVLHQAMQGPVAPDDAATIRLEMERLNQTLVFSPLIEEGDELAEAYVIQTGDVLAKIARKYQVPWEFMAKINSVNPSRIQIGKRLKAVKGPFHVTVHKSAFRLDVFAGGTGEAGGVFIRSFRVGLGEFDSTPTGRFIVKRGGKRDNPEWVNPRTGQRFHSDDPKNPLGEHWVGLRGDDEQTKLMAGYGIHGTIEPQTIGTQASMGCVRLMPEDIGLLYTMLEEEASKVTIAP
jgi:lipoprotein-anchoring transpeptidase ErfK/SrfK